MQSSFGSTYPFDHAVVNVRDRLDEGASTFRALGFRVTPRGFHTLGSVNHLIVFGSTYLELIGFPADNPSIRPELREAAAGLNGIVFRTTDSGTTYAECLARGAPVLEPQQFSRPVDLGDEHLEEAASAAARGAGAAGWPDAVFRTVRTQPGFGPGGRVYFCEHLTPELVWRDAWRQHPNTAIELTRIRIEARDPKAFAQRMVALLGGSAVRTRGEQHEILADPLVIELTAADTDRMLALGVRVADLAKTRAVLNHNGVRYEELVQAGQPVLRVAASQAGGAQLEFSAA